MKKNSIILVATLFLLMLFGTINTFSAASISNYGELVPYTEDNVAITVKPADDAVVFNEEEISALETNQDDTCNSSPMALAASEGDEVGRTFAYPPSEGVAVRKIFGYPLVYCEEDKGLYYFENIFDLAQWPTVGHQSMNLHMNTAEVKALYNKVNKALTSLNDGRTYYHAGWRLVTEVELVAERPKYVEWTPTESNYKGTEKRSLAIPYTSCTVTIDEWFNIPVEDPFSRYTVRVSGAFYRLFPNGGIGGIMMGAGITCNSDA